jgi:hypothetical protein
MVGDDRVRFCGLCKLTVYNISEMPAAEAEDLIRNAEGRMCIRMYQRRDGTVLTRNCPVGIRAVYRRLGYALSFIMVFALGSLSLAMAKVRSGAEGDFSHESLADRVRGWPVVGPVVDLFEPRATSGAIAVPVMGKAAVVPTTPPTPARP